MTADTFDGLGHGGQLPAPFGVEKHAKGARHRDGAAAGDAPRLEVVQHHCGARNIQCELNHRCLTKIQLASQERRNPVCQGAHLDTRDGSQSPGGVVQLGAGVQFPEHGLWH